MSSAGRTLLEQHLAQGDMDTQSRRTKMYRPRPHPHHPGAGPDPQDIWTNVFSSPHFCSCTHQSKRPDTWLPEVLGVP